MFDNTLNSSWDERSRRGMTTLTSFGLQALAVGVLLIVPLLRPAGLPLLRSLSTPVSLGRPLGEPPAVSPHTGPNTVPPSNPAIIILRPSLRFPIGRPSASDDDLPPIGSAGSYIPGNRGGSPDGVPDALGTDPHPVMPAVPRPDVPPVRVSHMSEGDLIHKVLPVYPPLARSVRIQGQVVLQAVISKQGAIENLRLLTGHPMLVPAAI